MAPALGAQPPSRNEPRWLKPVAEYAPLGVFLVTYMRFGLMPATAALIVATAAASLISFMTIRRVPPMPLAASGAVALFGGLTLWFEDETFIKIKPTVVSAGFAATLFLGLAFQRPLLKPLLGTAWRMDEAGWRRLSLRFGFFFAAIAVLNEIVWRTQPTDVWVAFKVFGILGLTALFSAAQAPLLVRHRLADDGGGA